MDIAFLISGLLEGVLPADGAEHFEAVLGQKPGSESPDQFFVLSDKNGLLRLLRSGRLSFHCIHPFLSCRQLPRYLLAYFKFPRQHRVYVQT
jgi:hypothetical protein